MRKRMAVHILLILIALSVTPVLSSPTAATRSGETAVGLQIRGPITVQRLLSGRIDWALRLARGLRTLDPNVVTRDSFDIESITDEPDPVGISRDETQEPPPGEHPEPERRDEEVYNDNEEDPFRAVGP